MRRFYTLLLPLFLFASSATAQTTWYVPADFPTIQAGIDGSSNGDTVIVDAGTYFENINFNGKAITLKSERGPVHTIIDANQVGSVVTFNSSETVSSRLEGFGLRNGVGSLVATMNYLAGGGIFIESASPSIHDCHINNNSAVWGGGGIWCVGGSPELFGCWIWDNTAEFGGGILNYDSTMAVNGGGIWDNEADDGAGAYDLYASTVYTDVLFTNNIGITGGGLTVYGVCTPVLNNCIFAHNGSITGGAILCMFGANATLNHCTITGNNAWEGGGLALIWTANITNLNNCIFYGNSAGTGPQISGGTAVNATYCDIEGGFPGTGNIDLDPQLMNPLNNFELESTSPCIDAGDPASAPDPDGTRTDMGAVYYDQSANAPTLTLSNLVAGQTAIIEIENATGNDVCYFAWSLHGGGPTLTPWGDLLLTAPYQRITMMTNASGYASHSVAVPPSAAGMQLWCHAADAATQAFMNGLALVVQ